MILAKSIFETLKRPCATARSFVIGKIMFDYYGSKWKKKRKKILRRDKYICQLAKRYGKIEEATVVHHIYPAEMYPEYAWCDWNLISLSLASHNQVENRKTGKLTPIGMKLMKEISPPDHNLKKKI